MSKGVKVNESEFKETVVAINRVAKVVKGGRRFSFSAIVVLGDGQGTVGHGLGKAGEVVDAISKAMDDARKNMVKISIVNDTVPHEMHGKYSGGYVFVKPAAPGTGIIAGGAMRAVLEAAGVHNVLAKSKGSSNPHNVVKATIQALQKMRAPHQVAIQRRVKLSTVFNG